MNRIKQLRLENGVKQADLAKYLNIAQNTLSYWEAGKYDIDNKSLKLIAEYFKTTTDFVLGISPSSTPPNKKNNLSPEKLKLLDGIGYAYFGRENKPLDDEDVDDILNVIEMTRKAREKRIRENGQDRKD